MQRGKNRCKVRSDTVSLLSQTLSATDTLQHNCSQTIASVQYFLAVVFHKHIIHAKIVLKVVFIGSAYSP